MKGKEEKVMTDKEYLIIDELYFVTPFQEVAAATELDEPDLKEELKKMVEKEWIRIFSTRDATDEVGLRDYELHYQNYYFLASKKGLLQHNTK